MKRAERATWLLQIRLVKRQVGKDDELRGEVTHETTAERGIDDLQAALTAVRSASATTPARRRRVVQGGLDPTRG